MLCKGVCLSLQIFKPTKKSQKNIIKNTIITPNNNDEFQFNIN